MTRHNSQPELRGGRKLPATTGVPSSPGACDRHGARDTRSGTGVTSRFFAGLFLALSLATGCRQIGKLTGKQDQPDLLEAELRTRERELQEARAELEYLRQFNGGTIPGGYCPPVPGAAVPVVPHGVRAVGGIPLRDVQLGSGTGGMDQDGRPGDEMLTVVVVPKDDDGTAVKVPGTVHIAAFEVSREGLKSPIGRWRITPAQLKKTWKSSLISSGYFIPLQWDKPPTTDRARVTIRFETPDGKAFEADKDINVKPLPSVTPRPGMPLMPPAFPGDELPPPGIIIPPSAVLPGPVFPDPEVLPPPGFPSFEPAAVLKPFVPR